MPKRFRTFISIDLRDTYIFAVSKIGLETAEERAHARLEAALVGGEPIQVQACQEFWLKCSETCSETLRRLDLAVELARRPSQEEQIPLRSAQEVVTFVSEWLRISIVTLLRLVSAEGVTLAAGFKTIGELKVYFIERLKGVMFLTLQNACKTNSPVPPWALERIRTAFSVEEPQEPQEAAAASAPTTPGP